jgi:ATP-dependent DNA helicase 2 subunit 2
MAATGRTSGGYQVSVYAIDISQSMGEERDDVGGSGSQKRRTKLSLAQEYVARKCEPKVSIRQLMKLGL